jgi:hypothetical protein
MRDQRHGHVGRLENRKRGSQTETRDIGGGFAMTYSNGNTHDP